MRKRTYTLALLVAMAALFLAVAACGNGSDSEVKEFHLTGVEWKGTTSADSLAPPEVDPTALSAGYRFKQIGFDSENPQNWQVASYVWTPGSMVVNQGDLVKLSAFIVNGDHHASRLIAPDGSVLQTLEMERGREYKLSFVATQPGTYRLLCDTHGPSMTANILSL